MSVIEPFGDFFGRLGTFSGKKCARLGWSICEDRAPCTKAYHGSIGTLALLSLIISHNF